MTTSVGQLMRLWPIWVIALIVVSLWMSGAFSYLDFASIKTAAQSFKSQVDAHPLLGMTLFFILYVTVVTLCLPAVAVCALAAGYLFGAVTGGFIILAGSVSGGTIVFLVARSSVGAFLRARAAGFYKRVEGPIRENAVMAMIFLRLLPGVPSAVANILPALFDIPLKMFVLTSMIGMVPIAFVLSVLGQSLGSAQSVSDLLTLPVLAALGVMALLVGIPVVLRLFRARRQALALSRPKD